MTRSKSRQNSLPPASNGLSLLQHIEMYLVDNEWGREMPKSWSEPQLGALLIEKDRYIAGLKGAMVDLEQRLLSSMDAKLEGHLRTEIKGLNGRNAKLQLQVELLSVEIKSLRAENVRLRASHARLQHPSPNAARLSPRYSTPYDQDYSPTKLSHRPSTLDAYRPSVTLDSYRPMNSYRPVPESRQIMPAQASPTTDITTLVDVSRTRPLLQYETLPIIPPMSADNLLALQIGMALDKRGIEPRFDESPSQLEQSRKRKHGVDLRDGQVDEQSDECRRAKRAT